MRALSLRGGVRVTVSEKDFEFACFFSGSTLRGFREAMQEMGVKFKVADEQPATNVKDYDDLSMYARINAGFRKEIR
jgi:hypothetical protein